MNSDSSYHPSEWPKCYRQRASDIVAYEPPAFVNIRTFDYDGWNLVHETRFTFPHLFEVDYVWGPDLSGTLQGAGGVGGLVAVSIGGQYYLPCFDAMGNVAAYLDETGAEVASFTYSAFGETLIQSGSLRGSFPFRFSTKWHETEVTEFCDYGRRWYWPAYGRWISRDPIEEEGGENLYAFCHNGPVSAIDPLGTKMTVSIRDDAEQGNNHAFYATEDTVPAPGSKINFIQLTFHNGYREWMPDGLSYNLPFYFEDSAFDETEEAVFVDQPSTQTQFYLLSVEVKCVEYLQDIKQICCCKKFHVRALDFVAWNTVRENSIPKVVSIRDPARVVKLFKDAIFSETYSRRCNPIAAKGEFITHEASIEIEGLEDVVH